LFVRREGSRGEQQQVAVDGGHVRAIDLSFTQSPPDSDPGYYDFDIGSPMSPDETCTSQPSLINKNDDLSSSGDQVPDDEDDNDDEVTEKQRTLSGSDGGESGYVFSTPDVDAGLQDLSPHLNLSLSSDAASDETCSESSASHYFDASEFWSHPLKFTKSNVYDAYNAPTEEKVPYIVPIIMGETSLIVLNNPNSIQIEVFQIMYYSFFQDC
jgi:hypothetical protein